MQPATDVATGMVSTSPALPPPLPTPARRHQVPRPHPACERAAQPRVCRQVCAGWLRATRALAQRQWLVHGAGALFKVQPLLLLNAAPQHDSARAPAETHWLPTLVAATALDRQVEVLRALTSAAAPSQRGASTLESSRQSNPAWAFDLNIQGGTEIGLMGAYPPL